MGFWNEGFSRNAFIIRLDTNKKVDSILMSNGIFDEFKIDETLNSTNSIEKEDWGIDTVLLAEFKNNLEVGNLTNQSIPIQYLRFKRRKVGELKWQVMIDIPFDKEIENYNIVDYYVENSIDYQYTLVPLVQSIEGNGVIEEIEATYFNLFLTGRNSDGILKNYPLRFDLNINEITLNQDVVFQKTLSSQFPSVMRGKSKYLSGSFVADVISPTTEGNGGNVDMKAENIYRKEFEDFLYSGNKILIRNHSLYILGNISESKKTPIFNSETAFGIHTFNMSFTETSNHELSDLLENDLTYEVTME